MLKSKALRYVSLAVFAILVLLVFGTFGDYGVTWDEELQSQYGIAVADYYRSALHDMRFMQIFNLYLYGGTFDGFAAFVDSFTPLDIYGTRHLLNAFVGLLGLWGTMRLARFLGGGTVALLALVMCAATPSYYGHMFNNPKDIPFAAGIVWSIYYMSRTFVKTDPLTLIKLGVIFGLTLGVRVGGVMLFAYWLAVLGIAALLPLIHNRNLTAAKAAFTEILLIGWRIVLPVGLLAYAIMLVCWPWAQQSPILNPLKALSEFSNFPQDVEVLLNGTTYRSTQLPWTYVPEYFAIQLPEIMLVLLAAAMAFMPRIVRGMSGEQKLSFALLLMMGLVPVSYALIRHPALYDTVRHFLFVIPLASIVAALGAREAFVWSMSKFDKVSSRMLVASGLALVFFIGTAGPVIAMIQLHPYEYIYANSFAGGVRGAYGRYESDYWGSSFKEAAQDLNAFVATEGGIPPGKMYRVAICGPWSSATIYLPPDFQAVVANEPAEFFLSTTRWLCQNMRPGKEIITVQRMGVPLAIVKDLRGGYEYYEGNEHLKP